MSEVDVATLRRKRGVVRASVIRIATRLGELEVPEIGSPRRGLQNTSLARDWWDGRRRHGQSSQEQGILDTHDNEVAYCLEQLTRACAPGTDVGGRVTSPHAACPNARQTLHAQHCYYIGKLTGDPREINHLVRLYQEQLSDYKGELGDVRAEVLYLMVDESDDLNTTVLKMDQEIWGHLILTLGTYHRVTVVVLCVCLSSGPLMKTWHVMRRVLEVEPTCALVAITGQWWNTSLHFGMNECVVWFWHFLHWLRLLHCFEK